MTFSEKQHDDFIAEVRSTIKTEFNGKMAALDKKLSDYIVADSQWKKENDQKWIDAQPGLDNMNNLTGAWKVLIALALGVSAIGAGVFAIKKIFQ